ncbi:MAG: hypothetical protein KDK70_02615, partial [Myxococcales bacterium]|nr:hypothetical protein [Myxococcales bacterium]
MAWVRWACALGLTTIAAVACDVVEEGDVCEEVEEQAQCRGGTRYCSIFPFEEEPMWGACIKNPECEPGDTMPCPGVSGKSRCIIR